MACIHDPALRDIRAIFHLATLAVLVVFLGVQFVREFWAGH